MLDLPDELLCLAVAQDLETTVFHRHAEVACHEGADEDHLLGVLADVDETSSAGESRAKTGHVEIAFLVGLSQSEERSIEAAAIVEVELVGLIHDRLGVDRRPEIEAAGGNTADDARFSGQGHQVENLLLVRYVRNSFGHADSEVDDAVGLELHCRAAGDDLAFAHLHGRHAAERNPDLTCEGGAVGGGEGLVVILRAGLDDAVDEDAGDLDLARVEGTPLGDPLDLDDHQSTGIVGGHGNGHPFEGQGFAFHGDIPVRVRGGATDDRDVDRESLVEEVFLAADRHQFDEVFGGFPIELAAAETRIHEGAEADARQVSGFACGDVTEQMGDRSLRKIVGFDLVADRQLLQLRDEPPVTADDALHQTRLSKMIESAILAVSLPGGIDEGEVPGLWTVGGLFVPRKIQFLDGDGDLFGETDADEAAGGDRRPLPDQLDRFTGGNQLAVLAVLNDGERLLVLHAHRLCFSSFSWGDTASDLRNATSK